MMDYVITNSLLFVKWFKIAIWQEKNLILPSTEYLHIGFNDIATEGTWQYATGGDLVYTNWGGVNPNNGASGNGEDCGETYSGTTWNDGSCNHKQPYICEMI